MELITSIRDMRAASAAARARGAAVGLTPTMGAFHRGHKELMTAAGKQSDVLVTSIFINPLQFGPDEDYDRYPRRRDADAEVAAECGVDYLFCPAAEEMYPPGVSDVLVNVGHLGDVLCGTQRPGHFNGVATVVVKLLNIVAPDSLLLGCKDYQQLLIIRNVVAALDMNVDVNEFETVRDADGLALSSRNSYLSDAERMRALNIYKGLCRARDVIVSGERDAEIVRRKAMAVIEHEHGVDVEYFAIRSALTLSELERITGSVLIACAARVGVTRLIDNVRMSVE